MGGRAPVGLGVEAAIGVANISLGLVAHRTGDALSLKDRGIKCGLSKCGCLKPFKKDYLGSARLQAERALDSEQASEIGLKRIEERKRFLRVHMTEISAKPERMFASLQSEFIHDLFPALLVKIGIAPVHAGGKGIQHLQVRLGSHRRKIKGAMPVLETGFVEEVRSNRASQAAHQ